MTQPKVLFVAGPGDVQGTYRHWQEGRHDPSIPNVGYSEQVYEAVRAIGGKVMVATTHDAAQEENDGFAAFQRVQRRHGSGLTYHRTALRQALQVRHLAMAYDPDILVVQATLDHAWLVNGIRCRHRVASLHNALWPTHRDPTAKEHILNRLNARFYRSCARVFCISEMVRRQVASLPTMPAEIAEVQIPLYRPESLPEPRHSGSVQAPARLIYTGRIAPEKGVFDLLHVVEGLPETVLDVVGGGPALDDLRAAVELRGLGNRVTLHGQQPGSVTLKRVAEADLLVCPTHGGVAEGLAKTPIEAAILGVPSVVTSVVPAKETLGAACRVLPPDDPDALKENVAAVLESQAYEAARAETENVRRRVMSGKNSLRSGLLSSFKRLGYKVRDRVT